MTVAPSRSDTFSRSYHRILNGLNACLQIARQSRVRQIASLTLTLPPLDPLVALLTLAREPQQHCYWESPSRGQAIAAWDELLSATFKGPNRFQAARQYLKIWQHRVFYAPYAPEGPYFFCSFSFFDSVAEGRDGFAPATVRLARWQVVRDNARYALVANALVEPDTAVGPLAEAILEQFAQISALSAESTFAKTLPWRSRFRHLQLSPAAARAFCGKVQQTLTLIEAGQLQKQVVAHALDITRRHPFKPSVALPRLRSQHPDCYIFAFSGDNNAHFIGASPERLLSIRQGRLVTDALAGSAPRGKTAAEDRHLGQQLLHNAKEQREHQLVLDFIVEQLRTAGLSPRYSQPPEVLRLSHIQHLHTPIRADLPDQVSPLSLVAALHPTPAVAGVPTAVACDLIRQDESCDRGLYAAPLGWVDPHGNGEFIVGIRSALIRDRHARLYAGAGIVAGSDPERELAEIQLKLRALAEALG